jgi:hypothetical protein
LRFSAFLAHVHGENAVVGQKAFEVIAGNYRANTSRRARKDQIPCFEGKIPTQVRNDLCR